MKSTVNCLMYCVILLNYVNLVLSLVDLALSQGYLALSKTNLSLNSAFYERKPRSFQQRRLHSQPQFIFLRFASEGEVLSTGCLRFKLATFHSHLSILLFHKGILFFQQQTFHSIWISTSESPGVSSFIISQNKKHCLHV